ncbi:MAG: glycosyltransferase family A protein [Planctomycetota bacterium]
MSGSPSILIVSPCRDEADYVEKTLGAMAAQTLRPTKWVIVDDGSTDGTSEILAKWASEHDWIHVVDKPNTGERSVGPGVINSFYFGLDREDWRSFDYVCKLDVDLDLPPGYFEGLLNKFDADPRLGTCSGKPWFRHPKTGEKLPEPCGDEMSVGMTKLYRSSCFNEIGGFVRQVMWDGIDCHRCRMLGWRARAYNDPELSFEHLRAMGSSHKSIWTGRTRHGKGQWFMGTSPWYMGVSAGFRLFQFPVLVGSAALLWGYFGAAMRGEPRFGDAEMRRAIRKYQWFALTKGKAWLADYSEPVAGGAT